MCLDVSTSLDLTCPSANILFFTHHMAMLFLFWSILTIRKKHVIVAMSDRNLPKSTEYAVVHGTREIA